MTTAHRDAIAARGRARFDAVGLPTTKAEAWRYFPTRALGRFALDAPTTHVAAPDVTALTPHQLPHIASRVVFVNGVWQPGLSDLAAAEAAGVRVCSLADAARETPELVEPHLGALVAEADGLQAANDAFFRDGCFIHVPANVVLDETLEILHWTTAPAADQVTHPRHLIVCGRSSQARVIERYLGHDAVATVSNAVTEIVCQDNAELFHVKVADEGEETVHVGAITARLSRDARYHSYVLSVGGKQTRTSVRVELAAAGASCSLDGLYVGDGAQRLDHYTEIDHIAPHCDSTEYYAGILDDRAVGNFLGVVYIREDAVQSHTQQMNKNLLLSEGAQVNTKPQLEIDNDDVKATHGATVGQLDTEALHYLATRGIAPEAARAMLTFAFAREVLLRIPDRPIADALIDRVALKLGNTLANIPELESDA